MSATRSVSVIGLGRVGLPLALCFADRGVRVLGVDHDPAVLASVRAGRMPFGEAGTQELLDRVLASGRLELAERAADAARADDIVITIGTPSFSHIESDLRQVRAARRRPAPDAPPRARPDPALDDRAGDDRVRRRLSREAARAARRRGRVRRPRARADRRGPVPRGDLDAPVHHRRRRRGLDRARGEHVLGVRRADRQDHAGPGGAREDLDEHPPLHDVRAAEPADDGLRAVRRERVRRDRPDQPRLPPRRDRAAGHDRRHVPAQGLRVLRGALGRARDAARRLARQRVRAAVPRRGHQAPGRQALESARSRCSG